MPQLKRICACGNIVTGDCPRCTKLQRKTGATTDRAIATQALYSAYRTRRWTELSKRKRAADPLCEVCNLYGITTQAEAVHHIHKISQRPDLMWDWDNLVSVCTSCHARIENNPNGATLANLAQRKSTTEKAENNPS